jgi:hypothetical protein
LIGGVLEAAPVVPTTNAIEPLFAYARLRVEPDRHKYQLKIAKQQLTSRSEMIVACHQESMAPTRNRDL